MDNRKSGLVEFTKALPVNTNPHAVHAYTHKDMKGDMAVRIQSRYNYIFAGQVCIYLSVDQAKELIEELTEAVAKQETPIN